MPLPQTSVVEEKNFSLEVPKLSLNVLVTPDVDIGNSTEIDTFLKMGVAQAKGSARPNQNGTVFIFGHSSDFPWNNNPFGTVFSSLDTLRLNDLIILHYHGQDYRYKVKEVTIVNANVTLGSLSLDTPERLFLSSCWPVGTDWKRVLVLANRID